MTRLFLLARADQIEQVSMSREKKTIAIIERDKQIEKWNG